MRTVELADLAVEVHSVSAIISGFAIQFGGDSDRLTDEYMQIALVGVSRFLDRIAEDMYCLDVKEGAKNADD